MEKNVDIVMCIDGSIATASFICNLKKIIERFLGIIVMYELGYEETVLEEIRIKFIIFGDYAYDEPMVESKFFSFPFDLDLMHKFIDNIKLHVRYREPQNGWEALYHAMNSNFNTINRRNIQVILFVSPTDALDLKERMSEPTYPKNMADMDELISYWNDYRYSPEKLNKLAKYRYLFMLTKKNSKYMEASKKIKRCIWADFDHTGIEHGDVSILEDMWSVFRAYYE